MLNYHCLQCNFKCFTSKGIYEHIGETNHIEYHAEFTAKELEEKDAQLDSILNSSVTASEL